MAAPSTKTALAPVVIPRYLETTYWWAYLHPNAVRLALERAREARQENPPVLAKLSERARKLDVTVRPHALDSYDDLAPGKPGCDDTHGPKDEDTP